MKLKDIALLIQGHIAGDEELDITGVSGLEDASEGEITYVSGNKWLKKAAASRASAIIVSEYNKEIKKAQVIVKNPQYAFALLLSRFYVSPHACKGISDKAFVSDKARIGNNVSVYPFAHISDRVIVGDKTVIYPGVFIGEGSKIGEDCIIYPNAVIREGITIGNKVIVHAGVVIGSDGFGYVFENGVHNKIPQIGSVTVEDDVEIGANTTIDRATTGTTLIGKGTKIDNLVQIGHNVCIGRNVILVAQVGIGGSSVIGDGVIIAGQSGISDHVEIEAGTTIGAGSGVMGKLSKGMYFGYPARPYREILKSYEIFPRLPEMLRKIDELQRRLDSMSKENNQEGN